MNLWESINKVKNMNYETSVPYNAENPFDFANLFGREWMTTKDGFIENCNKWNTIYNGVYDFKYDEENNCMSINKKKGKRKCYPFYMLMDNKWVFWCGRLDDTELINMINTYIDEEDSVSYKMYILNKRMALDIYGGNREKLNEMWEIEERWNKNNLAIYITLKVNKT